MGLREDRRRLLAGLAAGGLLPLAFEPTLAARTTSLDARDDREGTQDAAASETGPDIDEATLAAAERISGLTFKPEERRMMLGKIRQSLGSFSRMRAMALSPDDAPALTFRPLRDPAPAPRRAPVEPLPAAIELGPEELLMTRPIRELAAALRAGRISCLRLTEIALRRLERHDPTLHCVVTMMGESARAEAKRRDAELAEGLDRGPLHGIPWGAKDIIAVRGAPTTWGAKPFAEQLIDRDAGVVARLREAGAVLVAKLSTGALAMGDRWFRERTRNPWNPEQGSSGSSAGSASAVGAGLLPFALGSETLGSIVSPCTRCGVTGLRPTFGRVGRSGVMTVSWSMDKVGAIARHAEDCGLVLRVLAGRDPDDPSSLDAPLDWSAAGAPSIEGLKIAVPQGAEKSRDLKAIVSHLGLDLDSLPRLALPELPVYDLMCILEAEAASSFDDLTRSRGIDELVAQGPRDWPNTYRAARFLPAVELLRADRLRRRLMRDLDAVLDAQGIDVLITPNFHGGVLGTTNLTGHPTLCLPVRASRGRPRVASLIGRLWGEAALLETARFLQMKSDHHRLLPEAFRS
jgi:Asp-tRNA(Asn)/Glu-tRNA(Gln) amidotransferase A subunit family amidase